MLTILYSGTVGYHLKELQVGSDRTVQRYSRLSSKVGTGGCSPYCTAGTVGYRLKEVQVGAHHTVQLYSRLSSKGGTGRCSPYCTAVL